MLGNIYHSEIDVTVDYVGAEEIIQIGFRLLSTTGTYVFWGVAANHIDIPLFDVRHCGFHVYGVPLGQLQRPKRDSRSCRAGDDQT
jgi:hypothetical protein